MGDLGSSSSELFKKPLVERDEEESTLLTELDSTASPPPPSTVNGVAISENYLSLSPYLSVLLTLNDGNSLSSSSL